MPLQIPFDSTEQVGNQYQYELKKLQKKARAADVKRNGSQNKILSLGHASGMKHQAVLMHSLPHRGRLQQSRCRVFNSGGGGSIEPSEKGGFREKGSIDRTINWVDAAWRDFEYVDLLLLCGFFIILNQIMHKSVKTKGGHSNFGTVS